MVLMPSVVWLLPPSPSSAPTLTTRNLQASFQVFQLAISSPAQVLVRAVPLARDTSWSISSCLAPSHSSGLLLAITPLWNSSLSTPFKASHPPQSGHPCDPFMRWLLIHLPVYFCLCLSLTRLQVPCRQQSCLSYPLLYSSA